MRLYFLRHAEALDGVDDAARPLSGHGREQCRAVGRFLHRAGIGMDAAYSSRLVRARDTATLVLAVCGHLEPGDVRLADALGLDATQRDFDAWLGGLPRAGHVLLVGHAPSLAARVRRLTGMGDEEGFRLPKAGLACVETEEGREGRLRFFVTPKILPGLVG